VRNVVLTQTLISVFRLKSQIEELRKGQGMLEELKKRKAANEDTSANFRLADHVFVKAKIRPIETVGLWLGVSRSFLLNLLNSKNHLRCLTHI